ncbi:lysophospholipid acyltransferase family protein [Myxococcota bacterium]|nr:lysophospholipid acyltransferase family protein [Myxococcota bacterium]MBU1537017.1 lysophospholipid acyltransferase family protein [Myxococcota bacterium]
MAITDHDGPRCGLLPHLAGKLWLRVAGWRLEGEAPAGGRYILIGAPHTSNWDLPFTLASVYAARLSVSWLGKDSLFVPPFGPFFRWLGGIPVVRSSSHGVVEQIAQRFSAADKLVIAVSPPGTRSLREHWRSGFYYMALRARVPIVCGSLDFTNKVATLGYSFIPTGDIKKDMDAVRAVYRGIEGKIPSKHTPVRLKAELPSAQ